MNDGNVIMTAARKGFIHSVLHKALLFVVGVCGYFMVTCFALMLGDDDITRIYKIVSAVGVLTVGFLIFFLEKRKYDRFRVKLEAMADETADVRDIYGTYFETAEHIIVPQLYRIDDKANILSARPVFHRTNGLYDGAVIELKTADGKLLKADVPGRYLREIADDSGFDTGFRWR